MQYKSNYECFALCYSTFPTIRNLFLCAAKTVGFIVCTKHETGLLQELFDPSIFFIKKEQG